MNVAERKNKVRVIKTGWLCVAVVVLEFDLVTKHVQMDGKCNFSGTQHERKTSFSTSLLTRFVRTHV